MVELLVTYMEMTEAPAEPALAAPDPAARVARESLDAQAYLDLYRAVGEALQWDQRLRMPRDELGRLLADPTHHVHLLRLAGKALGFCEFENVGGAEIELVNFGLLAEAQGRRLGPYLLDRALRAVWSQAPRRVWLHTDTNDHPRAVATYERAGFRIYDRQTEAFED
jgi:ribosomal protein S18 acetylase RimI-like enzyme